MNSKHLFFKLIEDLLDGKASPNEIKGLFNFFKSHQQITTWQPDFESREKVKKRLFENIKKATDSGSSGKNVVPFFKSHFFKYAAAVLMVAALGYTFIYTRGDGLKVKDSEIISTVNEPIGIGSDKATLRLDDGTVVSLQKGTTYTATGVSSDGESIDYAGSKKAGGTSTLAYNYLSVPRGGQFFIKLSDGTKVWLNSETQLKYPVAFPPGQTRTVELMYGEAYFEVSPSTTHGGDAFKVISQAQTIDVVGTEFNVKSYSDEQTTYSTLVGGKISLNAFDGSVILKPNEQAVLNREAGTLNVNEVNVKSEIAWKDGIFSFRNKRLDEVMTVISRWYDVEVVFLNEELKEKNFKGVVKKKQQIENILEVLKNSSSVTSYKINKRTIYLE